MKIPFSKEQIIFLQTLNFAFDIKGDITNDQYFEIDERVSDLLLAKGFNANYDVNELGMLCEDIMDVLAQAE